MIIPPPSSCKTLSKLDSVFHALEPVVGKIAEKPKAPATFGRSLFGSQRSDWFRPYRVRLVIQHLSSSSLN
jgi:hypothetical protein